MTYKIEIGGKPIITGIKTKEEASKKCCLMLAMSRRLDIFYSEE